MSIPIPINAPAGYAPETAVAFSDAGGSAVLVSALSPLPVTQATAAATSTPLAGSAAQSLVAGPFAPEAGLPIWLTLSGTWAGTVTVKRSTDGGATRLPLTAGGKSWGSFSTNVQEPVAEDDTGDASYWLDIALASGTVAYRVQQ